MGEGYRWTCCFICRDSVFVERVQHMGACGGILLWEQSPVSSWVLVLDWVSSPRTSVLAGLDARLPLALGILPWSRCPSVKPVALCGADVLSSSRINDFSTLPRALVFSFPLRREQFFVVDFFL